MRKILLVVAILIWSGSVFSQGLVESIVDEVKNDTGKYVVTLLPKGKHKCSKIQITIFDGATCKCVSAIRTLTVLRDINQPVKVDPDLIGKSCQIEAIELDYNQEGNLLRGKVH